MFSEPGEEGFVPQLAILRFQHPMPFVRENQKLRRHALVLKRGEKLKTLSIGHAEIEFAGDYKRGRLIFSEAGGIFAGRPFLVVLRISPRRAIKLPFLKP